MAMDGGPSELWLQLRTPEEIEAEEELLRLQREDELRRSEEVPPDFVSDLDEAAEVNLAEPERCYEPLVKAAGPPILGPRVPITGSAHHARRGREAFSIRARVCTPDHRPHRVVQGTDNTFYHFPAHPQNGPQWPIIGLSSRTIPR